MSASPGIVSLFHRVFASMAHLLCVQSAFPKSDANLFEWAGTIEGASGTVSCAFRVDRTDASTCATSRVLHLLPLTPPADLCWPHLQNLNLVSSQLPLRPTRYQV